MTDPTTPDDRFERLQNVLLNAEDIDRVLDQLAEVSTTVAAAPLSCGITMRYDGSPMTVGSSDDRAELLDESQYRAGAGPCLQSMQTGEVLEITDALTEPRWPEYLPTAVDLGLRSSLSLPLTVRGETFGAMNVYSFEAGDVFGEAEHHQLELFAAQAAGTLWVAARRVKDTTLLRQMEESLRSRSGIDQALGIIMGLQHCSATVAFEVLRHESQNSRRRLREVADDLIARTSGQPPEPGRPFTTS